MPETFQVNERYALAVLADRNFDAAAASYIEGFVSWRRTLGAFNKVACSSARRRVLKNILRLHFSNTGNNPDRGATFERLLRHSNPDPKRPLFGPRVLRNVIAFAQRTGHVTVQQGFQDRRLRIIRPAEKWIEQEAERHELALASLTLLAEGRSRTEPRPRGNALVSRLAIAAGRKQDLLGVALGEPDEALRDISARDGGLSTAFALADSWIHKKRQPSHKEIGADLYISASQVAEILRIAAQRGLIVLERNGQITDASELVRECKRLVAYELAHYSRFFATFENATTGAIGARSASKARSIEHAD